MPTTKTRDPYDTYRNRIFKENEATCKGIILEIEEGAPYVWTVRRVSGQWATGSLEFPGGTTHEGDFLGEALARELREEARVINFTPKSLVYHKPARSWKESFDRHHKFFFVVTNPVFDPNLPLQDDKMTEPKKVELFTLDPEDMACAHGEALQVLLAELGM